MVKWTKATEIEVLRDTAARLGPHTYTGAWLSDVLPEIEHLIAVDYPIEPNVIGPRRASDLAQKILAEARETAAALLADAHSEADTITRTARERSQTDRQTAREDLRRLIDRFRDNL